jgi:2-hydroxychromene-2-carboxylate isomerase
MGKLTFFFDVVCPYAYLASTRIADLERRAGVSADYRPILLGGLLREIGNEEASVMPAAKARLNRLDMDRWADWYGVPLRMHAKHPRRTVLAMRTLVAAEAAGGRAAVVAGTRALYAAYWGRGEDISDPAVVQAALEGAGLDGAALVVAAGEGAIKEDLRRRTDAAKEAGVFGVPTFLVDDALFFGQDRIAFVERALSGWRPGGVG